MLFQTLWVKLGIFLMKAIYILIYFCYIHIIKYNLTIPMGKDNLKEYFNQRKKGKCKE